MCHSGAARDDNMVKYLIRHQLHCTFSTLHTHYYGFRVLHKH